GRTHLRSPLSERFQVLEQCILLFLRQSGAERRSFVALVVVARDVGLKAEILLAAGVLWLGRDEADVLRIVNIVPAIEHRWSYLAGIQQVAQRRHRSIVQIGRTEPDPVE